MIGDEWLEPGAGGRRRLDDPQDFVRLEIEAGLARGVEVIPVLVAGAQPPTADQLPEGLAALASRQALELTDSRWDYDVGRLVARLRELGIGDGEVPRGKAPSGPGGRRGLLVAAVAAVIAVVAVVAIVASGGGGADQGQASPPPGAADVVISSVAGDTESMPATYSFAVNDDLVGTDLDWRDWGEPSAAASGDFEVRAYPSTQNVTVPGTMLVSSFSECRGKRYYSRATVSLPDDIPFDPPNKFDLPNPCD